MYDIVTETTAKKTSLNPKNLQYSITWLNYKTTHGKSHLSKQ